MGLDLFKILFNFIESLFLYIIMQIIHLKLGESSILKLLMDHLSSKKNNSLKQFPSNSVILRLWSIRKAKIHDSLKKVVSKSTRPKRLGWECMGDLKRKLFPLSNSMIEKFYN